MAWNAKQLPDILGKTQVVGIIGNPIRHSLSPVMQNAAFAAGNLDYVYVPFAVKPEHLQQAVVGLKALGVIGYNVTIPHKTSIIPYLDILDDSAERAGAVNTVHLSGSALIGYNTDGAGLVDSLAEDLDFTPGDDQILVVGAGGAARGAIASLCHCGAKNIVICNRSQHAAETIMENINVLYPDTRIQVISCNQVTKEIASLSSLLLNTTSLGMAGEQIEFIKLGDLQKHAKVYDMVYGTLNTPLVSDALASGLNAVNGAGMLVAQGERAFEIWTGQKPVKGTMKLALNSRMASLPTA
ncbi:MAG: shikimate dehydrogenase [Desulfuromonadaceae bacterium]|nr:shikimate dehydrogenase [Desulfuromonadaceae bacterium]MDD5106411.1 shikimate dehydrogenase [Desulfuromonadaceae bacterium]